MDEVEKRKVIEYTQSIRIEYFDDRFYSIELPENFNIEKFKYKNLVNLDKQLIYLPSVTTYLNSFQDPQLIRWRGEVGNETADFKMKQGAELGSKIHDCINKRCLGYDVIYQNPKHETVSDAIIQQYKQEINNKLFIIDSQDVAIQLARFEKVMDLLGGPEIIETEKIIHSIKDLYAGTLDLIIDIKKDISFTQGRTETNLKKGKYIIDIKTGKHIDEFKYFYQLAAYSKACKVRNIKGALILHLNANIKTGIEGFKPYFKSSQELKQYYKQFINFRNIYLFELSNFKVTNYDIPIYFNNKLNRKEN